MEKKFHDSITNEMEWSSYSDSSLCETLDSKGVDAPCNVEADLERCRTSMPHDPTDDISQGHEALSSIGGGGRQSCCECTTTRCLFALSSRISYTQSLIMKCWCFVSQSWFWPVSAIKCWSYILRLQCTALQLFFLWVFPLMILWVLSCCFLMILSCFIFFPLRRKLLSSSALYYPVSFKPKATSLMVTKPYIDFSFAPSLGLNRMYTSFDFNNENHTFGSVPHPFSEAFSEDPQYFSSIELNEVDRAALYRKASAWSHPISRYHDLMRSDTLTSDVLVGFVSFSNTSWERFDKNGLTLEERCLYYHRARHFGYSEEAFVILKNEYWQNQFLQHQHPRFFKNSRYMDIMFKFDPSQVSLTTFRLMEEAQFKNVSWYGESIKDFLRRNPFFASAKFARHPSVVERNRIRLDITVELFDLNCSLIVRGFRTHILYKRKGVKAMIVRSLSFFLPTAWSRFFMPSTEIRLVDQFPVSPATVFYMGRIQIAPFLPDFVSEVVLIRHHVSRNSLLYRMENNPVLCFLIFCLCFTLCGSFLCLLVCGTQYARFLSTYRQKTKKK